MILPQLLWRFARHRDDPEFYRIQAVDAIRWLQTKGIPKRPDCAALDLGCGHGIFGRELSRLGIQVVYADESNGLMPEIQGAPFLKVNLDRDELQPLGRHDLVVCSNVLEHLAEPHRFLSQAHEILTEEGVLYLSWTNWLSPWGGHEFSPWHYLGTSLGPAIYDRLASRARFHHPHRNLFPTYIGRMLAHVRNDTQLELVAAAPRYFTEFSPLMSVPVLREFLSWNCALLLRRRTQGIGHKSKSRWKLGVRGGSL